MHYSWKRTGMFILNCACSVDIVLPIEDPMRSIYDMLNVAFKLTVRAVTHTHTDRKENPLRFKSDY